MAGRNSRLEPHRMTNRQLYERTLVVISWCRFANCNTWQERERYLDQLEDIVLELKMRGTQLALLQTDADSATAPF